MRSKILLVVFLLSLLSSGFLQIASGARLRLTEEQEQPIGVCYAASASNQPPPQEAVALVQSLGIKKMRLYGPEYNVLQSLRKTGIEVMLGVPNEQLEWIASSQDNANRWIQDNVQKYQDVNFRFIAVGSDITLYSNPLTPELSHFVLPAMQNIQNAVSAFGLENKVRVSTAIDQSLIIDPTYKPSQGEFSPQIREFMDPIIRFLVNNNNAPLLVNLYPYYSYAYQKADVPTEMEAQANHTSRSARLDYATFRSALTQVRDGPLTYTNLFDSMVDSLHSALEKAGGSSLDIVVSQIGWPTAGYNAANTENARTHNAGLIEHVCYNGTPKRPHKIIETYIFNLFDENLKDYEMFRHWGIFWNNRQAKYHIDFQCQY